MGIFRQSRLNAFCSRKQLRKKNRMAGPQLDDIRRTFQHIVGAPSENVEIAWFEEPAEPSRSVEVLPTDRVLHGTEAMAEFVKSAGRTPATIYDLLDHPRLASDQLVVMLGSTPEIDGKPRQVRAKGKVLRFAQPDEQILPGQGVLVRRP